MNKNFIVTDRGGLLENCHTVHAAVVDSNGDLLYSIGNPSRLTLIRSAAKPAQALAILETGCFEKFKFDNADLALMCASHNSEPIHLERAQSMLHKSNSTESDFACGGHASISEAVNRTWIKADYIPTPISNNCSGKHAGMIAGSKAIGADASNYHLPDQPMQVRVKEVFEELCGTDSKELRWGIDGCNLPAPAAPLNVLARVYASFASAADATKIDNAGSARIQHQKRIFEAMSTYPELVGGEGRFCTELMRLFNGSLIGKVGADGCYAIGVKVSDETRRIGGKGALGIAVKIEDGNLSILYTAVLEILKQLGLVEPIVCQGLASFDMQKVLNTAGVVTGNVTYQFKIRPENLKESHASEYMST